MLLTKNGVEHTNTCIGGDSRGFGHIGPRLVYLAYSHGSQGWLEGVHVRVGQNLWFGSAPPPSDLSSNLSELAAPEKKTESKQVFAVHITP